MTAALAVIALIALFPALAGGLALGFHLFAPHWSRKKRIGRATLLATLVPMAVPFVAILFETATGGLSGPDEVVLAILAILCLTVIAGAVLCLPTAWYVSEKMALRDDDAPPPAIESDEDTPALAGAGS